MRLRKREKRKEKGRKEDRERKRKRLFLDLMDASRSFRLIRLSILLTYSDTLL